MKLIITFFAITFSINLKAQSTLSIDKISKEYQNCLDKGVGMTNCAGYFVFKMDSLLNSFYKNLRSNCDSIQIENLKDEQQTWLEKKYKKFKQNKKQAINEARKNEFSKTVELMFTNDKNGNTIKERVLELNKAKPNDYSPENYYVNPNGFYSLSNKSKIEKGETYGYFGGIAVKKISKGKIAIKFIICKSAPSYMGAIEDTLDFYKNEAIYKNDEADSTCKILFSFYKQGIVVKEFTNNINSGCGFGNAIIADGFFKKKSDRIPTSKELKLDEIYN